MTEGLLTGFRALDLTNELGFMCGKILAAAGVEVIKIEKPGGEPARNIPPYIHNKPNPENSLYWLAYNTDKKSVTLDITSSEGKKIFLDLIRKSDFVIESFLPGYLDSLGLGYKDLCKANPKIILTSITTFGQKGPYSHYLGGELIASAMSSVLLSNGDPDREPVKEGPDSIFYETNAAAALGTVLAHYHCQQTGEGQQVDVSMQEVAAKRMASILIVWEFDKQLVPRMGPVRSQGDREFPWIWQCRDGYVFWSLMGGKVGAPANLAISQWMVKEGIRHPFDHLDNWEKFIWAAEKPVDIETYKNALIKFFLSHTKKEIAAEGLKRGINAASVLTPSDILQYPQLQARNYWIKIDHPDGVSAMYPDHFFVSNVTENFVRQRAPHIGEHNQDIYKNILGFKDADFERNKKAGII
jgi:crotonobetainyl-CoA:carnitine CoA-transferase CaiB-like acyl-CoA transferase